MFVSNTGTKNQLGEVLLIILMEVKEILNTCRSILVAMLYIRED